MKFFPGRKGFGQAASESVNFSPWREQCEDEGTGPIAKNVERPPKREGIPVCQLSHLLVPMAGSLSTSNVTEPLSLGARLTSFPLCLQARFAGLLTTLTAGPGDRNAGSRGPSSLSLVFSLPNVLTVNMEGMLCAGWGSGEALHSWDSDGPVSRHGRRPQLAGGDTEAPSGCVMCPRSQRSCVLRPRCKPRRPGPRARLRTTTL